MDTMLLVLYIGDAIKTFTVVLMMPVTFLFKKNIKVNIIQKFVLMYHLL